MIKERVIDYQSTINVLYKFISECATEFQLKIVWNAPKITRSQRPADQFVGLYKLISMMSISQKPSK